MRDRKMTRFRFIGAGAVLTSVCALLIAAAPASAGKVTPTATYPGMTTYSCRTDALPIHPGQNLNLFGGTKTCPHAKLVKGPGSTDVFDPGSSAEGYITRFKPSMVEIKKRKGRTRLVTPSVWDLHLHHVVWVGPDGPTFASGEEKTIIRLPQGYGLRVGGDANWALNYMLHSLNAKPDRRVYITWEIDWVPADDAEADGIKDAHVHWMDVAGLPTNVYPVFDAERGFDLDGDGYYTFPDEIPTDPSLPGYEERSQYSPQSQRWTVPAGGVTLVSAAGHLHPGGSHVDLYVARDGPDVGSTAGDDPSEVKPLFQSNAHYYEPAGAVSWDVSMQATRPDWRIKLKAGDVVSINVTYDVSKASWYESMGILPVAFTTASDPAAKDPFDDAAAVKSMYDEGGMLTHKRLPENIDSRAGDNLKLPNPANLKSGKPVPASGIKIKGFQYARGGYSASRNFPTSLMRPPTIEEGQSVSFTSLDALPDMTQIEQAWHTITSCKDPCNRGSGIGYPLAAGPIKFDSGELGYGNGASTEVTTGSNEYTTPVFNKPGTYTYFCRIHPFMRGSIRVTK
jgi:plastocyanin